MLNLNHPIALPGQLKWTLSDETTLLEWTIKARNYNTFVVNTMFWCCFISLIVGSTLLYRSMDDDPFFSGVSTLIFFSLVTIALTSITHQRMNFAYRITKTGIECCEWKTFPKWALTFLKWFTGITAVIFIFLVIIDPVFLIGALLGPGGMGLMYLSTANSKSFKEMHTEYHHLVFEWENFTQLAIATNREVVDMKFTLLDQRLGRTVSWSLNIFCKKNQKENVARLIKPYLSPTAPFIRAKVNVPLSTDQT